MIISSPATQERTQNMGVIRFQALTPPNGACRANMSAPMLTNFEKGIRMAVHLDTWKQELAKLIEKNSGPQTSLRLTYRRRDRIIRLREMIAKAEAK